MYIGMMKKAIFLLLSLLFFLTPLFCKEYVTQTEHFDFIWSDETKLSAEEIISRAEGYYSSLVTFFCVDPELHIPVYFKSDIKSYNAYYTAYTQNHIVLFVTAFSPSLFSNTVKPLALTFFHELTHAFTCSIKSPFVSFLSSIFGDVVIPGNLYLNKGFVEGIAVYVESINGEGRLNDNSSLYLVNQMAAEGLKFNYLSISGSRDVSPGGTMSYILGASFLEYLAFCYGEYRVSSFIVECYRFPLSTTELIFKKIFGVKLSEAWIDYTASVTVEETLSQPQAVTECGGWRNLTLHNGTLYSEDSLSSSLYEIAEGKTKRVKLTQSSFGDLSFSSSYLLLPFVTSKTCSVRVSYINGGTYREWNDYYTGLLLSDERVLLFKESDGEYSLDLYDTESKELLSSYYLGRDISLSSGIAISSDEALFLIAQNGGRHILDISISENKMTLIDVDDSITLNSLSLNSDLSVGFSYMEKEKGKLMKYGELKREGGEWSYITADNAYSGGIYYPVKNGDELFFVSQFFSSKRVSTIAYSSLRFAQSEKCIETLFVPREKEERENEIESRAYNPLQYMKKGMMLPFGYAEAETAEDIYGFGLYYVTIDPTEKHSLSLSFGYNREDRKPFNYLSYRYKDYLSISLISWYTNDKTSVELDTTLSYKKTFSSDNRYILLSDKIALSYIDWSGNVTNTLSFYYQNAYKMGIGRHEKLGWGVKAVLINKTPSLEASIMLPRLIPTSSTEKMTYSIPVSLDVTLSNFTLPVIGVKGNFYLFTYETQFPIRFMRLYLNALDLVFAYSGVFKTGTGFSYTDTYSLRSDLTLSPLIGMISTISFKLSLGVTYNREQTEFSILFHLGS